MDYNVNDIEDFIKDTLAQEKKDFFEEKLKNDSEFRAEVEQYKRIFSGLKIMNKEDQIKHKLSKWESKYKENANEPIAIPKNTTVQINKYKNYRKYAMAASILLLIGAFYWLGIKPLSDDALYANFYSDQNMSTTTMSTQPDNSPLKKGYDSYNNNKYQAAIYSFKSIPEIDPNFNIALYYIIHAQMHENNWSEANKYIRILNDKNDSRYQEEIEWLNVLCYFRMNDNDKLETSLNKILNNSNHFYYDKALEFKQDSDSFIRNIFFG